jgi:hypothetical protein
MTPPSPACTIVLATYNGAAHLDAQIESIQSQSVSDWRLIVRDDGSRDETRTRLAEYASRDSRIEILPFDGRRLGAAGSFALLLELALDRGARYVFPSDQDDVWLPRKVERMLALMRELERVHGADTPVLLHSDLRVVADDLTLVTPSFVTYQRIQGDVGRCPARLLIRNSVTGCAALANQALLRRAFPAPPIVMHDWWLAQCAAVFGQVAYLDEPTILYRQHGRNAVGAKGFSSLLLRGLRTPRQWWAQGARTFVEGLEQLWAVRARAHDGGAHPELVRVLDELYAALGPKDVRWWRRGWTALRSEAAPAGALLRILFVLRALTVSSLRLRFGTRDAPDGAVTA